jgi:hypothetical protein
MLTMHLSYRPFSRWPTPVHVVLIVTMLLMAWFTGHTLVTKAQSQSTAAKQSLEALQLHMEKQRVAALQVHATAAPDFTQSLPGRSVSDDVVRDMGRHAASMGVGLGAVTVVHQDANARELGKVQFTVSANAEYGNTKTWLAELLARYASLAVQTLSVRANAGEGGRQEWQLVFTLYVQD